MLEDYDSGCARNASFMAQPCYKYDAQKESEIERRFTFLSVH